MPLTPKQEIITVQVVSSMIDTAMKTLKERIDNLPHEVRIVSISVSQSTVAMASTVIVAVTERVK